VANETQVRLLKQGWEVWDEWRNAHPDIRPDLSEADLSRINLSYIHLDGADLHKANLSETSLVLSKLKRADLRFANLERAILHGASGTEANLKLAKLNDAEFIMAKLGDADLSGATLIGAKLMQADLHKADLSATLLGSADLSRADLRSANLSEANLIEADFTGADISHADFSKCTMDKTQLGNVDLSQAKGLETVKHYGPSTIGIDTIYRSGGNIPEVFLRGAGVPEPFIVQIKALVSAMSPIEFYSCFISYSHQDKAFARRLHDTLQKRGVRCWLDEHQLLPGDDIYKEVDRGIRLWDKMLLCCSENSLKSWWVDNEIGTAFEKEQQLMNDRGAKVQVLVPLNLDGYLFSNKWKSGYQAQVRRRLAADFTEASDADKFDEQVERLIRALRADEGAREKPPKPRL
jgi:uncharacterized protein YjbI with pentapeptide repeats